MDDIKTRVIAFIERERLIQKGDRILVALSGGPDSVMLLSVLMSIKDEYDLTIEAFHLNHQLRKNAADDEKFAMDLCNEYGIYCTTMIADIQQIADKKSCSVEQAGRDERYRLLDLTLQKRNLNKIATAHHADDQIETMIMRMIRGTGIAGLSGIPIRRDEIIRPLLFLTKEEINRYLKEYGLSFVIDETNKEDSFFRNRVRNHIVPLLEKENPNIHESFQRLAQIAQNAHRFIEVSANEIPIGLIDEQAVIRYSDISESEVTVQEYVIRSMMRACGVTQNISFAHVQDLLDLIHDEKNTTWDYNLPNLKIKRRYDKISASRSGAIAIINSEYYHYPIGKNGVYIFPKERYTVRMKPLCTDGKVISDDNIKQIDFDKIRFNLYIRNKKPGDFFCPLGMQGKKKLKKYFIDHKIPKEDRQRVPLLLDGDDIVCILGMQIDERYKIDEKTKSYLQIEYKQMED